MYKLYINPWLLITDCRATTADSESVSTWTTVYMEDVSEKGAWQPDCKQDEAQGLGVPTVCHVTLPCIGDRGKRQMCCALAVGSKGYLYICIFEGFHERSPKASIEPLSREKSGALQLQKRTRRRQLR